MTSGPDVALRRHRILFAAATIPLLLLAGCSDSPPKQAGTVDNGAGSDPEPQQQSETADNLSRAGRPLTKKEAKTALPAVSVMPAGWSVDPENTLTGPDEESDDDVVKPQRCEIVFEGLDEADIDPAAEAGVTFTAGMLGPFIGVEVASYDEEVPEDRLQAVLDAMSECPKFTVDDGESVARFKVSALSFPNFGEESAAVRMSSTVDGTPIGIDFVSVRVGHNLVTVSQASFAGPGQVGPLKKATRTTMRNLSNG